jgi:hypothetical protein
MHTINPPSRRGLLATGTAALLAGAAIATTARAAPVASLEGAGDDAELIALAEAILTNDAESDRLSQEMDLLEDLRASDKFMKERIHPLVDESWRMREELAAMRATTLAGFRAKARVVQRFNNCWPGYATTDQDDAMAWSLANDLLGVSSIWRDEEAEEDAA